MTYYIFKITYFNEYKDEEFKNCGLVAAKSYSGAIDAITRDWGEDCLISLDFLMPVEENTETLTLNDAMFHMFRERHNEKKIESYHLAEKDYKGKAYFDFPEEEGGLE